MKRVLIIGTALALGAGLAGCSSESATEASADYCAAVTALQTQVQELTRLITSDATLDELRAQAEAVEGAADAVDDQAVDVDDAIDAAMDEAQEAFEDAIEAIPGNATASEAAAAYKEAASTYNDAVADVFRDLGC